MGGGIGPLWLISPSDTEFKKKRVKVRESVQTMFITLSYA